MVTTALPSGLQAVSHFRANVVHCVDRLFTFSGGVNADNDIIQIAKLPAGVVIKQVEVTTTDLDSGTDVEIDIGLNPAPGGTSANAAIVADGLTAFTTTGGQTVRLTLPPTVSGGSITAGKGLRTHATLESTLYATLIDQGDATSGTLYFQVEYYYPNDDLVSDAVDNS